jgi:hypothetical protein
MSLRKQLCAVEYVLTQGYSQDVKKDEALLQDLRFRYERYLKLTKLKNKLCHTK